MDKINYDDYKVGTRVLIIGDNTYGNRCSYPEGEILVESGKVARVKFLDGSTDVFNKEDLKIINLTEESTMPVTASTKKTVCDINFSRVKGDQILSIKVSKEIADLFVNSNGVGTSDVYLDSAGAKLKFNKEDNKLEQYTEKFRNQSYSLNCVLNRYGTNLIVDGKYNFSVLRTIGIEDGVKVKVNDLILEDDVNNWVQGLGAFIKFLYKNYIDRVEVKATIVLEV